MARRRSPRTYLRARRRILAVGTSSEAHGKRIYGLVLIIRSGILPWLLSSPKFRGGRHA
jgi:hypothetical protein